MRHQLHNRVNRFLVQTICGTLLLSSTAFAALLQAPEDFSLKASDGKEYGLKNALGSNKAAVVIFVATQCPYSNAYNARYNELAGKLKSRQVALLAINSNDTEPLDAVTAHAKTNNFSFPVLKDEKHKVADLFKAERTPEVFLVTKAGAVAYHGRIDDDGDGTNPKRTEDLVVAVDSLLANNAPVKETKELKAFGCSIKRK